MLSRLLTAGRISRWEYDTIKAEAAASEPPDCNDPRHDEIETWYRQALAASGAVPQSERAALEQAAKVAEAYAERLKHTSHRDGLGMGWQAGEELCLEIADRIRALASPAHPDE
jgi:hypothetical protein